MNMLSQAVFSMIGRAHGGGIIICEHTLSGPEMRAHIDVLGRHFEFIGHDQLLERLRRRSRRPFCLITFDDGKKSNASQAAPELERLGVPAVFYVSTDYISGDKALWFDRYASLRKALGRDPLGMDEIQVKRLPWSILLQRLEAACLAHGIDADVADEHVGPMSWEDLRALAKKGFTIGAHTRTHPVLTGLPASEAMAEISDSIERVSREIGTPCVSFAFTNGNNNYRLIRRATEAGAVTVMTTDPAWVTPDFAPWRLPRVQLFGGQWTAKMELKMALAASGFLLPNPDGSGRNYWRVNRLHRDAVL